MKTRIFRIDPDNIDDELIAEAGRVIKEGGLVAFPTETVYGLGGDAFNRDSSRKIYAAKGRPSDNPLIVHIADIEDLSKVAYDIPDTAYKLAEKFWPGPMTLILKKLSAVPDETTGGLSTVAVRFPSDVIAQKLIKASGGFIAAPSANKSGRPSPTLAKYVIEDLEGEVEIIIDGGSSDIGLESTIVDLTEGVPTILRPGYITKEDIAEVTGKVDIDKTILDDSSKEAPKAPGMKYKHYAPSGDLTIVYGENDKVVSYINEKLLSVKDQKKTGVIATSGNLGLYKADVIKDIGLREDELLIAQNLFRILREFDDEGVGIIYSEGFKAEGISMATMNRLMKAAGGKEVFL